MQIAALKFYEMVGIEVGRPYMAQFAIRQKPDCKLELPEADFSIFNRLPHVHIRLLASHLRYALTHGVH